MTATIIPLQIKMRATGAGQLPGAPATLLPGELAYNANDNTIYIGHDFGGANGTALTVLALAGSGAFVGLTGNQTIANVKTFSGACAFTGTGVDSAVGVTQSSADDSTRLATTAYVKSVVANAGGGTVTGVTATSPVASSGGNAPVISLNSGYGDTLNPYASKTATHVLAAPNATNGVPSFRALADSDIPTLTAAKISDFNTQVQTSRLDQMAAPTSSVSLNSQRITGLADPSSAQDAATKAYVDATRQGLDVKDSVLAATTANITLSGTQTVDGVSLSVGNRVLVKNQSTASQNGIYVVAAGAWTRADDANSATNITPGLFTFVEQGTANADSGFILTTDGSITVGTTGLTFVQFSGAGQITAGTGLAKTGNTIEITTVPVVNGGTNLTTVPQGTVLVANTANTITALGSSTTNKILAYNATSNTVEWITGINGGTY